MRIELCGGIASGKTTLAAALRKCFPHCSTVLEDIFSQGVLNDFYRDPRYYAFETEIYILLQHMHQIKTAQREASPLLCDFSLEQDYSYGESNLKRDEFDAFQKIYQVAMGQLQAPDLIIFLECPVDVLLHRIAERGQASEKTIDEDYLRMTISQLKGRLKRIDRKTVVIDSSRYDFRKKSAVLSLLSGPLRLCRQILEPPCL